jgi:hypothetical protein
MDLNAESFKSIPFFVYLKGIGPRREGLQQPELHLWRGNLDVPALLVVLRWRKSIASTDQGQRKCSAQHCVFNAQDPAV